MKPVLMFVLKNCPYCKQAKAWMEELKEENPELAEVAVTVVDEGLEPNVADKYDYYYVPTYYVEGRKIHEGAASKEIVRTVLEKAAE